jgi:hypothetical protein
MAPEKLRGVIAGAPRPSFTPGLSPPNQGPQHALDPVYGHLPTPYGKADLVSNEQLRSFFMKIGLENAATDGCHSLLAKYRERLKQIADEASEKAVNDFLAQFKD